MSIVEVPSARYVVDTLSKLQNIDVQVSSLLRIRAYEQDFEDGTTDLTAVNCTQTVQSTTVYAGNYALQVTIPAGQTGYVETPSRLVSPNQRVTFSIAHKEDANITDIRLVIVWYRSSGIIISVDEYPLTVSQNWTVDSITATAPRLATYMALRIQATASTDGDGNVYIDDITIDLVGQVFRVDANGNLLVAVDNFPTWFTTSTKTTDDIVTAIQAEQPRRITNAYDQVNDWFKVSVVSDAVGLAKESTLQQVRDRLPASLTASGNFKVAISEDNVGLLKEGGNVNVANFPAWFSTSTKTTDDVVTAIQSEQPRRITNAYDSANDWFKVSIVNDGVGLATETTLQSLKTQVDKLVNALSSIGTDSIRAEVTNFPTDYPDSTAHTKLDTIHSDLYDTAEAKTLTTIVKEIRDKTEWGYLSNLDVALSTRASESTLQTINNKIPSPTASGNMPVAVAEDSVGLAKDSTLQQVRDRLPASLTASGNFKVAISEDNVGLLKEGGNVNIANFPAWFTTSTKTTDDIVTAIQTEQPRLLYGYDGTQWRPIAVDSSGRVRAVLG
jgi:hypothetical protein